MSIIDDVLKLQNEMPKAQADVVKVQANVTQLRETLDPWLASIEQRLALIEQRQAMNLVRSTGTGDTNAEMDTSPEWRAAVSWARERFPLPLRK